MKQTYTQRNGFTLMEIAIAATILLLLAGMAVPAFSDSIEDAEIASAQSQLARVRTAVDFYSLQHREDFPGESGGSWTAAVFENQLRLASDIDGNTAAVGTAGFPFGPYLTEEFPANPFNGLDTIALVAPGGSFAGPDDSTGWVFFVDSGTFRVNSTEVDKHGDAVYDL
jgi:prepilin-type N-terminal cleavage/methylation domain-containing protein